MAGESIGRMEEGMRATAEWIHFYKKKANDCFVFVYSIVLFL